MNDVTEKFDGRFKNLFQLARKRVWWLVGAGAVCTLLVFGAPFYADLQARGDVYPAANVPKHDVAIVFGAGLDQYGQPSHFLESRLLTAVQLYKSGKARVLVMSGDNHVKGYDEPTAMKNYVVAHGVPVGSVVLDYAGFDTYDTCYREHALFGVDSAILVTHGYHLPRALMTCNKLGIKSIGVKADRAGSDFSKNYLVREILSTDKAALQLALKSRPDILGPKLNAVAEALTKK
jgi:vancomycin permeability regulator SanA